jgi:glycosyltransferase involved in cell wall biosynthesis
MGETPVLLNFARHIDVDPAAEWILRDFLRALRAFASHFFVEAKPVTLQPMDAPHIVHFFPGIRLSDGGVVRAVLDLCTAMAARGNRVTLVTFDSPDVPPNWPVVEPAAAAGTPAGVPNVVLLPVDRPAAFLPRLACDRWGELLDAIPNAVVHFHTPWLPAGVQLGKSAVKRTVPFVVTIHGMLDNWSMARKSLKKKVFLLLGGRRHLRRAATIHWTATAEHDQGRRHIGTGGPVDVILPCLVDLSAFADLPDKVVGILHDGIWNPVLLFLSRLHEKKGAHDLIDAAAILRDRGMPFSLVIAGPADPGYEPRLRRQVETLKLSDRVRFTGMVTGAAKVSLLREADLFILPTRQENFGLVLIEAMAAGCPVLTTRGTDIWRELEDSGAVITDAKPAVMADAIERLLANNRNGLVERGRKSRAWAMERFEPNRLAGEYEKMYRACLAPGGSNP